MDDNEYRKVQYMLIEKPDMGDMMPGTGGFRKLRFQQSKRKRANAAVYALFIIILCKIARYGFSLFITKTKPII